MHEDSVVAVFSLSSNGARFQTASFGQTGPFELKQLKQVAIHLT